MSTYDITGEGDITVGIYYNKDNCDKYDISEERSSDMAIYLR